MGGHDLDWTSPAIGVLFLLSGAALGAFIWVERRAVQPIIPLGLIRSRSVGIAALGMALMAAGLFATSLFTPLFIQGVTGRSATQGGAVLAPMMLAWVLASVVIGQVIARLGRTRLTAASGMGVAAFGLWLMASMSPETEYAVVAAIWSWSVSDSAPRSRRLRSQPRCCPGRTDGGSYRPGHLRPLDWQYRHLSGIGWSAGGERGDSVCYIGLTAGPRRSTAQHVSGSGDGRWLRSARRADAQGASLQNEHDCRNRLCERAESPASGGGDGALSLPRQPHVEMESRYRGELLSPVKLCRHDGD